MLNDYSMWTFVSDFLAKIIEYFDLLLCYFIIYLFKYITQGGKYI